MLGKLPHGKSIRLTQPDDPPMVLPGLYVEGNKTYSIQDDGYDAEQQDEPRRSSFVGTLMHDFSVRSPSMETNVVAYTQSQDKKKLGSGKAYTNGESYKDGFPCFPAAVSIRRSA